MTLNPKSQAIVERYKTHRARCEDIEFSLGVDAAQKYHQRHKAAPGSSEAEVEYTQLIRGKLN